MLNKLYLVRHAESIWNAENRFTGHVNIGLTDYGIQQAYNLKKCIEHVDFFRCLSSPLERALHTANILSDNTSVRPEVHHNLIERDYGSLTGMNRDEARSIFGEQDIHAMRRNPDARPPGGESLIDVVNLRIQPFLLGCILPSLSVGNTLVVAHGNSIRAIVLALGVRTLDNIAQYEVSQCHPVILMQSYDKHGEDIQIMHDACLWGLDRYRGKFIIADN